MADGKLRLDAGGDRSRFYFFSSRLRYRRDGDGIIYECEFPSVRRGLRFGGYEKTGCCVAV